MPKKGINLKCGKCGRFPMTMTARRTQDKYREAILILQCTCGHSVRSKAKRAREKAQEILDRSQARKAAVDYWAMTTNVSSNAAHAYKDGEAICGSPLKASQQRWETPGCIGCKKCRKIWDTLEK